MPAQQTPRTARHTFPAYLIAVAALSILSTSYAKANTQWTITVSVNKGTDPPKFGLSYTGPDPTCGVPAQSDQDPENLYVCPGDTVIWIPATKGQKGWLIVEQVNGFQPAPGAPPMWFRGKEDKSLVATVTTDANDDGSIYEYCVAVHDDNGANTKLFVHDPKIIVGGSNLERQFKLVLSRLTAIVNDPKATEEAKRKARKQLAEIHEQVQKLRKLLQ
ncbi:MAG TPA: hypothetical protein VGI46_11825 [Candidatus Acidoferrum sp.]|jgi:plastocyanin